MGKLILVFFALSIAIGLGLQAMQHMNNLERWNLTKTVAFSTLCALGAITIMIAIVVLF